MKNLFGNKIFFIVFLFMSFSLPGGTSTINAQTQESIVEVDQTILQDSLYHERIKNINRLEQMKYVVQKMSN